MDTEITKRDLAALIKSTEKNRAKLQATWRKVENLEAAINATRELHGVSNGRRDENGTESDK